MSGVQDQPMVFLRKLLAQTEGVFPDRKPDANSG